MPSTTSLQGIPVPVATDAPDGPTQMANLAKGLEPKTVMTFTSAANRTSAFTAAAVSPAAGMLCYRSDAPGLNRFEYYNATAGAWRVHGNYQDSVTLTSTTASVTFSAIPTYLRVIRIAFSARGDAAATFTNMQCRFGGDTGANYSYSWVYIQNGSTAAAVNAATAQTTGFGGYISAASTAGGVFAVGELSIAGWDAPTGHTTGLQWSLRSGYFASGSNHLTAVGGSGLYTGTATLNSITLLTAAGSLVGGSEFTLTGWE